MRHTRERLLQNQALIGKRIVDTAAVNFLREPVDVPFGCESTQREFETVLPGEFPVARARIAAGLRKYRQNVLTKRGHCSDGTVGDDNLNACRASTEAHDDLGAPIAAWKALTSVGHVRDPWLRTRKCR